MVNRWGEQTSSARILAKMIMQETYQDKTFEDLPAWLRSKTPKSAPVCKCVSLINSRDSSLRLWCIAHPLVDLLETCTFLESMFVNMT